MYLVKEHSLKKRYRKGKSGLTGVLDDYAFIIWALIEFKNTKLALVIPEQHPRHIAVKRENLEEYGAPVKHRDGSESVYIDSPDSNTFELIRYPE